LLELHAGEEHRGGAVAEFVDGEATEVELVDDEPRALGRQLAAQRGSSTRRASQPAASSPTSQE
jgi:hypothetical protein